MNFIDLTAKVIHNRKGLLKMYGFIVLLGIIMIITRKLLHFPAGYTFLLWNLFLAMIPLVLSSFLVEMNHRKYKEIYCIIVGLFWILFLPNGPYLLTDYKYIWNDHSGRIYQNIACLSWFIIPGIFAAVISLNDISNILLTRFDNKIVAIQVFIICMVTGFGVYIGVMRYNSWDILHQPLSIFNLVGEIIVHPFSNWLSWMTSFGYGFILYLVYQSIKHISKEFNHPES